MIILLLIAATIILSIGAAFLDFRTYRSWFRAVLILFSGALLIGFMSSFDSSIGKAGPVVLLTDGALDDDLSELSDTKLYSVERGDAVRTLSRNVKWLSSVEMLSEVEEPGQVVELYGYGTREILQGDFQWIDSLRIPQDGILLEEAPQQVPTGREFEIKGRVISESRIDTVILLRDGNEIRRQSLSDDGRFSFMDRLEVEGPALYHIEAETPDSLLSEPWHIRAVEPDMLSIAVMLYSPSFEVTHLSEWLGHSGHDLAIRTRVGEKRFLFEVINQPPQEAENLSGDFAQFDLLILDSREVSELSDGLVQSLRESLDNGLDVMLLPPAEESESEWESAVRLLTGTDIDLNEVSRIEERQWTPEFISLALQDGNRTARLPILNYSFEGLDNNAETPGLFENREPVIFRMPTERGSVSSHLFYQTYTWKLRGEMDWYADFWAGYLDRIITLETPFVEVGSRIPVLNERMMVTTSVEELKIRQPKSDQQSEISLMKGFDHPGVNVGYYWPKSEGWHVAESDEASRWFYVYDVESDWSFTEQFLRYEATRSEIQRTESEQSEDEDSTDQPISARWWLIGFLFVQIVLWAERKVVGS